MFAGDPTFWIPGIQSPGNGKGRDFPAEALDACHCVCRDGSLSRATAGRNAAQVCAWAQEYGQEVCCAGMTNMLRGDDTPANAVREREEVRGGGEGEYQNVDEGCERGMHYPCIPISHQICSTFK